MEPDTWAFGVVFRQFGEWGSRHPFEPLGVRATSRRRVWRAGEGREAGWSRHGHRAVRTGPLAALGPAPAPREGGGGGQQSEREEARMMRRRRDKRVGPRVKHEHGQMRGSHAADVVPALAGGFLLWGLARREE